jgi:hypothetical protein
MSYFSLVEKLVEKILSLITMKRRVIFFEVDKVIIPVEAVRRLKQAVLIIKKTAFIVFICYGEKQSRFWKDKLLSIYMKKN